MLGEKAKQGNAIKGRVKVKLTAKQVNEFLRLLWDYLRTPKGYRHKKDFSEERRLTGRGIKSFDGLMDCIEDILNF